MSSHKFVIDAFPDPSIICANPEMKLVRVLWLLMPVVLVYVSGINTEENQDHCLLDSSDDESPSDHSCKTEEIIPSGVSLIQRLHGKYPEKLTVPRSTNVHISVKSTSAYHKPRLSLLLLTWLQTIEPEQVPRPFKPCTLRNPLCA